VLKRKFMKLFLSGLLILVLVLSGCASQEVPAPEPKKSVDTPQEQVDAKVVEQKPDGAKPLPQDPNLNYVDTAFMEKLIKDAKVTSQRNTYNEFPPEWEFVLIDARPAVKFAEGHIPGAINIPFDEWDKYKELLPEDKNKPLYFYCGGLACGLSPKSAHKAKEMGYINVYNYQEGEPGWSKAGNYLIVTDNYIKNLLSEGYVINAQKKPYLILDARPYTMYFEGHIPNSIAAPDDIFVEKLLAAMPKNKDTELITYCGGFFCGKSHKVANILVDNGYTNVKVFAGGMPVWTKANLPVFGTKSSGATFDLSAQQGPIRGLTPAEWQAKMKGNYVVLDVRTAGERENGAIKGSLHIPSGDIKKDPQAIASQLPTDKNTTILIHCASGVRASSVIDDIVGLGYKNAFYLKNRIVIDQDGNYSF